MLLHTAPPLPISPSLLFSQVRARGTVPGGMLKQLLRTFIVSALSYDPNSGDPDPLAACAEPSSDKCGRIDKAHDCYHL